MLLHGCSSLLICVAALTAVSGDLIDEQLLQPLGPVTYSATIELVNVAKREPPVPLGHAHEQEIGAHLSARLSESAVRLLHLVLVGHDGGELTLEGCDRGHGAIEDVVERECLAACLVWRRGARHGQT